MVVAWGVVYVGKRDQEQVVPDEYLRRTAAIRLVLTDKQQELLEETINQWKVAVSPSKLAGRHTGS
ncbi:Transposable element, IS605 OrfB family [Natrarchaeobaculum sulfurireducens]|uniref:Transposable element, IS605 OrfB family n=1 Tax=Natrarchaeobaculum sulfurireducens TaxID=2044521 RepID=A0A346PC58_9EURY|nr:Transposable element, IS605 OrfB family [Natrarchaeobaculum sulfurireducens]